VYNCPNTENIARSPDWLTNQITGLAKIFDSSKIYAFIVSLVLATILCILSSAGSKGSYQKSNIDVIDTGHNCGFTVIFRN
jgi:hypothetical protein